MTSLTTIIVMVPIVIIAGESIREFVFPLMVGVLAGTYSSICVCSPVFFELGKRGRTSEYQRQIKEAEKKAKKKAKKEGKPYVPKKISAPEEAKAAEAQEAAEEAKAAETAETAEPAKAAEPVNKPDTAAQRKKEVNKKRSKRYVKGAQKKEEYKEPDDTFRL